MQFTELQLNIINSLFVSEGVFNISEVERRINITQAELDVVKSKIKNGKPLDEIQHMQLVMYLNCIAALVGPYDAHSMTGYSWEEVQSLIGELSRKN